MKILPVAFDSIGVRSMATLVRTENHCIFIDPAVALAPRRFGLPPTELELYAESLARERIKRAAKKCDVIFVSHYHYDHHPKPSDNELYEAVFTDKVVFAKNPNENVNFSAKRRGYIFTKKVRPICKALYWADDVFYDDLEFSPAVWHGNEGSKVGFVVMLHVYNKAMSLVYGSDAQNLADNKAKEWVIEKKPDLLIVDGFPTNFIGWRISQEKFEMATKNLIDVLERSSVKKIILEHHALRDLDYRKKLTLIFKKAEEINIEIQTFAEFIGLDNLFLEGHRKEIVKKTFMPKEKIDSIHAFLMERIKAF